MNRHYISIEQPGTPLTSQWSSISSRSTLHVANQFFIHLQKGKKRILKMKDFYFIQSNRIECKFNFMESSVASAHHVIVYVQIER